MLYPFELRARIDITHCTEPIYARNLLGGWSRRATLDRFSLQGEPGNSRAFTVCSSSPLSPLKSVNQRDSRTSYSKKSRPRPNAGAIRVLIPNVPSSPEQTNSIVTAKQTHQWQQLCLRAVKEPDPAKQMKIVAELNRLLQNARKPALALTRGTLRQRGSR
jgi:hypothetical protein